MVGFRERACSKIKQTREESAPEDERVHGNGEEN